LLQYEVNLPKVREARHPTGKGHEHGIPSEKVPLLHARKGERLLHRAS
jgi:hypothetical protein